VGSTSLCHAQMPEKLMRSSSEQTADMLRALAADELLNNADVAVAAQVRGLGGERETHTRRHPFRSVVGCKRHSQLGPRYAYTNTPTPFPRLSE
jgi:hypothetical protein